MIADINAKIIGAAGEKIAARAAASLRATLFRGGMAAASVAIILLAAGCQREKMQVYDIPKETNAPAPAAPSVPPTAGVPPLTPPEVNLAKPAWEVPKGWEEQPASGMRLATFIVRDGQNKAELSVIALPGAVGGTLANVNRWRGQIGLAEISESDLATQTQAIDASTGKAILVDMASADQQTRLLGAMVSQGNQIWFYKMTGPNQLVESQKEHFVQFIKSVRYPHAQ